MSVSKKQLLELIESLPEKDIGELFNFAGYLKMKNKKDNFQDLMKASESSLDFWNNSKDDEVWNNV
ncbi:MAG: DUF2281 domain-containing protein [Clostridia bacterium]|nr:DUF2281 domain-containing protein [Clostridia bacterium]MDD4048362.1 DUF2281 domain-containing protein [Clostridia bacterium]